MLFVTLRNAFLCRIKILNSWNLFCWAAASVTFAQNFVVHPVLKLIPPIHLRDALLRKWARKRLKNSSRVGFYFFALCVALTFRCGSLAFETNGIRKLMAWSIGNDPIRNKCIHWPSRFNRKRSLSLSGIRMFWSKLFSCLQGGAERAANRILLRGTRARSFWISYCGNFRAPPKGTPGVQAYQIMVEFVCSFSALWLWYLSNVDNQSKIFLKCVINISTSNRAGYYTALNADCKTHNYREGILSYSSLERLPTRQPRGRSTCRSNAHTTCSILSRTRPANHIVIEIRHSMMVCVCFSFELYSTFFLRLVHAPCHG